jgi:hypothetical protein
MERSHDPPQLCEAREKTKMNEPNGEFYWGTIRGKEATAYSGTVPGCGDGFNVERYEAALVRRYGAPMFFKVSRQGCITAINGYDPENLPEIPVAMMCVAKVKDLPDGEPMLGTPLSL